MGKKPSTSELKDLMTAIYNYGQKDVLDVIADIGENLPLIQKQLRILINILMIILIN